MLYFLGMSHAISVLRAIDSANLASHHTYGAKPEDTQWTEMSLPPIFENMGFSGFKSFLMLHISARISNGIIAATPAYWQILDTINKDDPSETLVSFIGGNEHSMLSILDKPNPYDFYTPEYTEHPMVLGRQPIPLDTVENLLNNRMHGTVAMLTAIRFKHPSLRIIHVMPPPPITSEDQIRQSPEIFKENINLLGITPISVRVKFYRVYCRLLSTTLSRLGIASLPYPPEVTDEFGGLKTEYALGCTHGNEVYGQKVVEQLALALRK